MSVIATALKHLIAAGLSGDDLVRAVAEMEGAMPAKLDRAAENKRAYDREYRRNQRANRTTSYDSPDINDIVTGKENPPDPHKNISPPVEAKASTAPRGRSDRGSRIGEDWQAPPTDQLSAEARAKAAQWPASAYRAEAEAFLNYWLGESGAKARKSNWNRAWANRIVAVHGRVMREAKYAPPEPAAASARQWSAEERAAYLEKLERREATGPPRSIAAALPHDLRPAGRA